jgi:predicted ATPase
VNARRDDLPVGTLTMVFTDIVDSTRLLADLGDRYGPLLADHRRGVREIVARRGGFEVDTQGDAFFLVFPRASDAVAAACEIVDFTNDGSMRVRMGIHTGEPTLADEGYVGIDVHTAARIAAAAGGGQILLSEQTRALVQSDEIRDLGVHRLKGVGEVHVFQSGGGTFPPLPTIGRTNLIPLRAPPLGRAQELDQLRSMLDRGARLVTVTGVGGIGKTTTVRALASMVADRFPNGVWFADLSAVTEVDLVESAVASVLGGHGPVTQQVATAEVIIVLDNLEQVLGAGPVVADWLDRCPGLTILVTSREPLRLSAEQEYPLSPLDDEDASQLFLARARATDPAFSAEADALHELCRRLEGIPLAIELAAARVKLLPPEQLAARLDRRLSLLTGGPRDLPARQQTLEATIAWSYDLLEPDEKELFARLALFAGGWTLDAAEQVARADLDDLQSLTAKNLVTATGGRFAMLETIREFAVSRLTELGDATRLRRTHARYYAALAARTAPDLTGRTQDEALGLLAADEDNLRAALDWCSEDAESSDTGLALAADLVLFWYLRSRPAEAASRLDALLAATTPVDSGPRAAARWGAGMFLAILGDARAGPSLRDALAMAGRVGDRALEARSLNVLGLLAFFEDDLAAARSLLERSIEAAHRAGDDWCLADALGTIGSIYPLVGELALARRAGGEALSLARGRGDLQGTRMALFGLALAAWRAGDHDQARSAAEEGLEISRRLGDTFFSSYFLWVLAGVEVACGAVELARPYADEALALGREVGAPLLIVCALETRAAVDRLLGNPAQARALRVEAERTGLAGSVPGSYVSEVVRALAVLDAEDGDLDSALRRLGQAAALARAVGDPLAEHRAEADLARITGA